METSIIKKGKVVRAEYTGKTWQGPKGTIHYHDIEFDNGDKGQYGSINEAQGKFIIGAISEYELIPNNNPQYPAKIKPVQLQNGQSSNGQSSGKFQKGGNGNGRFDPTTMLLSYAKDIYIAKQQTISGEPFTIENMFTLADRMCNWYKQKEADHGAN